MKCIILSFNHATWQGFCDKLKGSSYTQPRVRHLKVQICMSGGLMVVVVWGFCAYGVHMKTRHAPNSTIKARVWMRHHWNPNRGGERTQRHPDSNMEICGKTAYMSAGSNGSFVPSRLIVKNNRQTIAIHLHSGKR